MDELISLAKRLADYVRMTIEIGELKPDSPIGIAYRDFMQEWDKCHITSQSSQPDKACPKCATTMIKYRDIGWECPACQFTT